ncbi:MAG: efflux RND transporter periplasmic adaptor subunit [Planctomycetes bacterium]|nr:efflux RND transporter periplasmic adaptor subunit [Planctomycetota bacterium]
MKTAIVCALTLVLLAAAGAAAHLLVPGGLGTWVRALRRGEAYTCPMVEHAHVRASGPGRCPECGMDLVPLSQVEHKGISAGGPGTPNAGGPEGHAAHAAAGHPAGHGAAEAVPKAQKAAPAPGGSDLYYCPMHPTYKSDRPGDCPICNMSLVAAKGDEAAAASSVPGHAAVTVRPERRQLIGVKTAPVEMKAVAKTIRAAGRVEYDERRLAAVNLKFGGWIEELHVKSTGETVRKGDPLFAIYSQDLLEAQQSYLLAAQGLAALGPSPPEQARAFAEQSLRSARGRLLLWDLGEDQLRALEARREPETRVTIRSKVDGVVTRRNVVLGTFAQAGMDLYEVADLSEVWVHADVYEQEVPLVKVGQTGKVRLASLPGEVLSGEVVYVYPYLDAETRTVRVRLAFANPEGKLKPGMYGDATIEVPLGERLVIDDDAVLDSGERQIVFVDRGEGRLEPRQVKVEARAGGLAVIAEGLEAGEVVVTSGNFLIDSESRLKAALLQGAEGGTHKH